MFGGIMRRGCLEKIWQRNTKYNTGLRWCDGEKSSDGSPCTRRGVFATEQWIPFQPVAVCFGRVFEKAVHEVLYGKEGDPWEQWMMFRGRPGYVVTPGLPGGALDPQFAGEGAFPYFQGCPASEEPECIYVQNVQKGRMEYWLGRRGAKEGQELRLHYSPDNTRFPVIYIFAANMGVPRSVYELAARKQYRVLSACGWTDTSKYKEWASKYNPKYERAWWPLGYNPFDNDYTYNYNSSPNYATDFSTETTTITQRQYNTRRRMKRDMFRKNHTGQPVSINRRAAALTIAQHVDAWRTLMLGKKHCRQYVAGMSDAEVKRTANVIARVLMPQSPNFYFFYNYFSLDAMRLLHLALDLWIWARRNSDPPNEPDELYELHVNSKQLETIRRALASSKYRDASGQRFRAESILKDGRTWAPRVARAVIPDLCAMISKMGRR